jgi:hypothetical protein
MQLIQPTYSLRPAHGPFLKGTVVGGLLLIGGLALGWVALATPVVHVLAPPVVRPAPDQVLLGALVWGLSLVFPPAFAIGGAIRLSIVASSLLQRPKVGPVSGAIPVLGDEYFVAPSVRFADGRVIRNLVIGPFGVAVIGELPAPSNVRRQGTAWEMRRFDGRWVPLENPLDKATRDAERIRHWIADDDRDFIVKVYAAVLIGEQGITRSATCAAITVDQIPGWLASLPPQRSLNADRRAGVVERIRSIA